MRRISLAYQSAHTIAYGSFWRKEMEDWSEAYQGIPQVFVYDFAQARGE